MRIEARLAELGIELPRSGVSDDYYGKTYGKMRPHRLVGNILFLSGHTAGLKDGKPLFPGRVGATVSVEEGYEAARLTAVNAIAGIKDAVGDLDQVVALVRALNFVACDPSFTEPHKVVNGLSDLFEQVFGPEIGVGCRASIGVTSLADDYCFETWITVEVA